jgi:hypothetical protein
MNTSNQSPEDAPQHRDPDSTTRQQQPSSASQQLQADDMGLSTDAAKTRRPRSFSQQHRSVTSRNLNNRPTAMGLSLARQHEEQAYRNQTRSKLFPTPEAERERRTVHRPPPHQQAYASPLDDPRNLRPHMVSDVLEPLAPLVPRTQSGLATLVIGILSLMVIVSLSGMLGLNQLQGLGVSGWGGPLQRAANSLSGIFDSPTPNPPGNYNLRGAPSLNAAQVDEILASYGSPAHGTGRAWVELGRQYDIDPAFALAFFIHESTAGTHPNWAGLKSDGTTTYNVGNIICAGYPTCYGRFRSYNSWEEGIEDWYRLIDVEYIEGRGTHTVAEIIPVYAPAVENDVGGYVRVVEQMVDGWRWQYGDQEAFARLDAVASVQPRGNPLNAANIVVTQGYNGAFSHTPTAIWGALDIALDGNGDGEADPDATWYAPVYATHSGVVTLTPDGQGIGGNHVWIANDQYRTGYAHLAAFTVSNGQYVERGTQIGTVGSTGQSSGPHLDYQVWVWQSDAWVNVNPQEYHAFDPIQ